MNATETPATLSTILVPLDGSPLAELGLRSARPLAGETGATLLLVQAVPFTGAVDDEGRGQERFYIQEAGTYLEEMRLRLANQGVRARTLLLPGDPVRVIEFAAQAYHADLIAMATHGRTGIANRLVGSVAQGVLRAVDMPVLLTRAAAPPRDESGPFRTILVALDGTPFSESAPAILARTGIGQQALVILVRAVNPEAFDPAPGIMAEAAIAKALEQAHERTERRREDAEAYLRGVGAALLPDRRWAPVVALGDPGRALTDAATARRADLIVLATHGRHGVDRLLHGSVAQVVLRHAEAPVLVLRGKDPDEATTAEAQAPSTT